MKKNILIILTALVLGAGLAYYQWSKNFGDTNVSLDYELGKLDCDLLEEACKTNFKGADIEFELTPRPVSIMKKTKITIRNLNYDFYDAKLRVHGLNMDMGTIIANLEKVGDNTYETSVALSACLVEDVMRYRLDVYDGNNETGLYMDFDMPNYE